MSMLLAAWIYSTRIFEIFDNYNHCFWLENIEWQQADESSRFFAAFITSLDELKQFSFSWYRLLSAVLISAILVSVVLIS